MILTTSAFVAPTARAQTGSQHQQPQARSPPRDPAVQSTSVEEVVVTASKRSETLQNVPSAITAITSQRLDVLGVKDFNDYMQYVPSLADVRRGRQ